VRSGTRACPTHFNASCCRRGACGAWDPTVALRLGIYGDHRGLGVSYERGTPKVVAEDFFWAQRYTGLSDALQCLLLPEGGVWCVGGREEGRRGRRPGHVVAMCDTSALQRYLHPSAPFPPSSLFQRKFLHT